MKERNVTQLDLSKELDIRQAAISELINLKRTTINIEHLEAVLNYLKVEEAKEFIELKKEIWRSYIMKKFIIEIADDLFLTEGSTVTDSIEEAVFFTCRRAAEDFAENGNDDYSCEILEVETVYNIMR